MLIKNEIEKYCFLETTNWIHLGCVWIFEFEFEF